MGEWVAEVAHSAQPRRRCAPRPGAPTSSPRRSIAAALDGLLGTVAGDDTMLCVADEALGGDELAATAARPGRDRGERDGDDRA